MSNSEISATADIQLADDTMNATLSLRSGFSGPHIKAAIYAAQRAHVVEDGNRGAQHGPWFDEMMIHVPVAIVMSAAAVEASVNEWVQDVLDSPEKRSLVDSQKRLLEALTKDRGGNALGRFERLCLYLALVPDDKKDEWQKAKLLISFRNYFMHFKPEWDNASRNAIDGAMESQNLPLYPHYATTRFMPYARMTYPHARWAIATAGSFVKTYSQPLGLVDRVSAEVARANLP